MEVTQYYSRLSKLWQELDMFDTLMWKCADDGLQYRKTIEKERAFDFLAGLNKSLDDVCGHLISQKLFPSIREIFAEVRREERQKSYARRFWKIEQYSSGASSLGSQKSR